MRRSFLLSLALLPTLAAAQEAAPGSQTPAVPAAAAPAERPAVRLPAKRVVLYKNGVGYFEHRGRISGSQQVPIHFTTAQLDDVLKSLTVVDLGGGQIRSVRFNSVAPLSQQLQGLRLPFGEGTTRLELLNALRGARVEVRSGAAVARGRLITVERVTKPGPRPETAVQVIEAGLLNEAGELRTLEVGTGTTVHIVDSELHEDVRRYLAALGGAQESDVRRMVIATSGTGSRELMVSYISQVPVWKSTYRLILPENPKEKALLQGWAIVDNTVGEDWNDVQLSLVAGAPQSFVQPISQPYYVPRPEVDLPGVAQLTPQAHAATMRRMEESVRAMTTPTSTASLAGTVRDPAGAAIAGARVTLRSEATGASQTAYTDADGRYRFSSVPAGPVAIFVESPGFQRQVHSNIFLGVGRLNEIDTTLSVGAVAETVEVTSSAPTINTTTSMLSFRAEAEGMDAGTLFRYDLKQPISIGKNQSALVPILQARVEAEPVTLWNRESRIPLNALWLTNSSGYTLDAGTFNVVEGGAFAGEGLLDPLRPEEKRLLSYAADTAVRIKVAGRRDPDEDQDEEDAAETITRVRIANGMVHVSRQLRSETRYEIHNSDSKPRQVILEHPVTTGWKLEENIKPEETSATAYRLRVAVEPGKTTELQVVQSKPDVEQWALTSLDDDLVALLVSQRRIDEATEQAIRSITERRVSIAGLNAQLAGLRREVEEIGKDQARLRENLKALKGSSEERALVQRYTRELNTQEDRLAALRQQMAETQRTIDEATRELATFVRGVSFEGM